MATGRGLSMGMYDTSPIQAPLVSWRPALLFKYFARLPLQRCYQAVQPAKTIEHRSPRGNAQHTTRDIRGIGSAGRHTVGTSGQGLVAVRALPVASGLRDRRVIVVISAAEKQEHNLRMHTHSHPILCQVGRSDVRLHLSFLSSLFPDPPPGGINGAKPGIASSQAFDFRARFR